MSNMANFLRMALGEFVLLIFSSPRFLTQNCTYGDSLQEEDWIQRTATYRAKTQGAYSTSVRLRRSNCHVIFASIQSS
jgi:hypothetical protein